MKIMMVKTASGKAREDGAVSMKYLAGTQYEATEKWQEKVFSTLVSLGFANEIGGNAGPTETKATKSKPAKSKRGRPPKKKTN